MHSVIDDTYLVTNNDNDSLLDPRFTNDCVLLLCIEQSVNIGKYLYAGVVENTS